jgi:outer membrane receptor protein involved in Fe transport
LRAIPPSTARRGGHRGLSCCSVAWLARKRPVGRIGEPVTVSATGKPQRVSEAPANMEIITADDIRRSGADNIPDILQSAELPAGHAHPCRRVWRRVYLRALGIRRPESLAIVVHRLSCRAAAWRAGTGEGGNYVLADARVGYRLSDNVTVALSAQQFNVSHLTVSAGPPVERRLFVTVVLHL